MSGAGRIALGDPALVDAIAGAVDPRYGLLVRLLRHTALRWSEATALQRKHCHVAEAAIEVERRVVETAAGPRLRPLRSIVGWVRLDEALGAALAQHLDRHVPPGSNALVFADANGDLLRQRWFEEEQWRPALRRLGLGEEPWGVDSLKTAWLWRWMRETQPERQALTAYLRGGASVPDGSQP